MSGEMISKIVCGTLVSLGFEVIDIGLASTPTTELAVTMTDSCGGIIITASHNPKQWNALKLLNEDGEFITSVEADAVIMLAENENLFEYKPINELGKYTKDNTFDQKHIDLILSLPAVDVEAIKKAKFKVALDTVNSVGGIILPKLLTALGVKTITSLFAEPTGDFGHNPEPLEKNLSAIKQLMKAGENDIAFVVDPDVDRLAMVCEDGEMYGEEYTLVTVADYILQLEKGPVVSNISSTRALRDITEAKGMTYFPAAVGEVNVVTKMKEVGAVIGGEGNGGVIYPKAHYGRDALVGIALVLTYLAKTGKKASEMRDSFPKYKMAKTSIELKPSINLNSLLSKVKDHYINQNLDLIDGVKINYSDSWVQLRRSNTEPIIRVYSEAKTQEQAQQLADEIVDYVQSII